MTLRGVDWPIFLLCWPVLRRRVASSTWKGLLMIRIGIWLICRHEVVSMAWRWKCAMRTIHEAVLYLQTIKRSLLWLGSDDHRYSRKQRCLVHRMPQNEALIKRLSERNRNLWNKFNRIRRFSSSVRYSSKTFSDEAIATSNHFLNTYRYLKIEREKIALCVLDLEMVAPLAKSQVIIHAQTPKKMNMFHIFLNSMVLNTISSHQLSSKCWKLSVKGAPKNIWKEICKVQADIENILLC